MGGLAIVIGFGAGILLTVAMVSFFHVFPSVDLIVLLAVLSTVLLAGLIGMVDDLLGMRQWIKALLPVFAALPLMAVPAGHAWIRIPYVGTLNFWIFYPLLVVPAGITIAANAVNMLAGFNGLETGLGIVAIGSLAILAAVLGETTALILLLSGLGALLGIIYYNWYPARILVGDIGTLSIGAIIATAVIVGNFETAGVIVIIPYAVDFLFKAAHGFPSSGWGGELRDDGKLHCPVGSPVGVGQFIMKITGGIKEQTLTLALMGIELIFGVLAIAVYL
jgi:UDP-N-acetylglucosamine--dolichyl-phosphate N-acetylglucosaminephosphotransferase